MGQVGWHWRLGKLNIARDGAKTKGACTVVYAAKLPVYNKHTNRKGKSCFKETWYGFETFNSKPKEYNTKIRVLWWYKLLCLWEFVMHAKL